MNPINIYQSILQFRVLISSHLVTFFIRRYSKNLNCV